ncbi:hypothetical protein FHS89_000581 [Rubricella aquisinus]|uniref:DUF3108 domain-containing protein n=1 Tax=Rubricella aquisinus TaxID=2028108 RepID=A0A840WK81_9RHOB|nr:DUF3108 domain-containing protein [Rubricella aquisinus]MBB5514583.1 hypothetical protein [Rubricella aquisinus]
MVMKPVTFLMMAAIGCTVPAMGAARPMERATFSQDYLVYVGGFRTATATAIGEAAEGRYVFTLNAESAGLVRLFADAKFTATVTGDVTTEGNLIPDGYTHSGFWDGETYTLSMDYEGGNPVRVAYAPEREPDDDPIPPLDTQEGTLDPVSALMALTWPGTPEDICDRRVETFSGSRRTVSDIEPARPAPDGRLACDLVYTRVKYDDAGQPYSDKEFPYTLELRPMADGLWEVWKISGPTSMGTMVVRRAE